MLREHNIVYSQSIYHSSDSGYRFPTYVNRLRRILTDFESIICEADEDLLDKSLVSEIKESEPNAFYPLPRKQYIREKEVKLAESKRREILEASCKGAEKAESCVGRGYKEDHWQRHIEKFFFKEFEDQVQLNYTLPGFKFIHQAFDSYVVRGHRTRWTEAGSFHDRKNGEARLTDPMPDIFFAFAINETPEPRRGCQMDSQFLNFEIRTLYDLRSKGLISSPITSLQSAGLDLSLADYYCFPWLIVEIKHDAVSQAEVEKLYCQAANGASVALRIFEVLAEHASNKEEHCHVPPVICLTFQGPKVKLWLAYSSLPREAPLPEHKMICVWESSIATAWGSLQLECILENAKVWALRILKPMLSSYIDTHRYRPRAEKDNPADGLDEITQIVARTESLHYEWEEEGLEEHGDDSEGHECKSADLGSYSTMARFAILFREVLKAHNSK